jgi:iron only hydrogenase large subunit-like protein
VSGADVCAFANAGKLVAALKELGFDYVFDTNFAADVTIMEEGFEFIRRLQNNDNLPMFTSCCPGWVNLVRHSHPCAILPLPTMLCFVAHPLVCALSPRSRSRTQR